jgi:hypothetical protein
VAPEPDSDEEEPNEIPPPHERLPTYVDPNADADFLALVHEADSAVLSETAAPRFDGPVSLAVWQPIACSSVDWPSRTFELVAGTGTVDFGAVDEILEREAFELSEEWMADAKEASPSTAECV